MSMTLTQALEVAEQASPMPYVAHEALRVLKAEADRSFWSGYRRGWHHAAIFVMAAFAFMTLGFLARSACGGVP